MTKPKSHTVTVGDFTLEVGLDEHRVLLDLTQLLDALHRDYGQKESEAKYAYAQAEKLQAKNDALRVENAELRKRYDGLALTVERRMGKLEAENKRLREELEVLDSKLEVESSFTDKDETYVAFYRIPAGPWHKILGLIRG